ncbi:hypothetical protein KUTeg_008900 [Tegillarca granosa]|uniref:Uncharacterized protein n=1 Tax=Tegillarca granosa TaxID=220873 RepID=A0ABQ9FAF0_TEGGR|nr:hypothetical protein KUTeg_008900 [Tegillarca granosa]
MHLLRKKLLLLEDLTTSVLTRDLTELSASHEEADTRIILQAIDAQTNSVVVCATDIDVFILLVAHLSEIKSDHVWMMTGTSTKRSYIPIKDVFQRIPPHSIDSLLAFHSLTRCDTTSFFYGHSKKSSWSVFLEHYDLLKDVGNGDIYQAMLDSMEKFVSYILWNNSILLMR